MLGQLKFADPVLWPNILSADYPDLLSRGAQKWGIEKELPRGISFNATSKTNRLRVLASSPDASDRANYGRSRSSCNIAAPATSDIVTESKRLMHLLQEGVRLC